MKNRAGKTIVFAICGIILILAVGVFVWAFQKKIMADKNSGIENSSELSQANQEVSQASTNTIEYNGHLMSTIQI